MNYEQILKHVNKAPATFATKRGQLVRISAKLAVTVTDDFGTYDLATPVREPKAVASELLKHL